MIQCNVDAAVGGCNARGSSNAGADAPDRRPDQSSTVPRFGRPLVSPVILDVPPPQDDIECPQDAHPVFRTDGHAGRSERRPKAAVVLGEPAVKLAPYMFRRSELATDGPRRSARWGILGT
jgi:hypothetical protein